MSIAAYYAEFRASPADVKKCLNCTMPDCRGYCRKTRKHSRVRCVETGEVFDNQNEAAASVGRSRSTLCSHLTGAAASCGGLHFEYVEGE